MLALDFKLLAIGCVIGYSVSIASAVSCFNSPTGTTKETCTRGCYGSYTTDSTDSSGRGCQAKYEETLAAGFPTSTKGCIASQSETGKAFASCYCNTDDCNVKEKAGMTGDLEVNTKYLTPNVKDSNRKCYMQNTGITDAGSSASCNTPNFQYCTFTKTVNNATTPAITTYAKGCGSGPFRVGGSTNAKTVSSGCQTVEDTANKMTYTMCLCQSNDCNKDMETAKKSAGSIGAAFTLIAAALFGRYALF